MHESEADVLRHDLGDSADLKQNGNALRFASDELQDDEEVVFAAVKKNGMSLKYASDELRVDKEVVLGVQRD